jgi:uncharacterized protein DUF6188
VEGSFRESDEGWTIALEWLDVTMCNVDYAFTLVFWALDQDGAQLRVEVPFELVEPDGTRWLLDPERNRRDLGPALDCFGKTVARLFIDRQRGGLELAFADGTRLSVEPHPKFEAWDLTGPGSLKLVCTPGGGEPAMWL